MIPYSTQTITATDIVSVTNVLKSKWLTTGPTINRFEKQVAKFTGSKYAVAISNGTVALHLACLALDISKRDEVITTPYSFVATANCVLYCGAKPIFVDIEYQSMCIDTQLIEKKITKKTKAIIAIDFAGLPADWKVLIKLAKKYNLKLIADGAHSFGGKYFNKPIGTQADLTCFSFHPVKTITTGEGGMITTNKKAIYEKLKSLRHHGIVKMKQPWFYKVDKLGYNYRMTDIQAALGLSQLKRVKQYVNKRKLLAKRYNLAFKNVKYLTSPQEIKDKASAWHLYPLRINFKKLGKNKIQLFNLMKKNNIKLQVHYIPIHWHDYFKKRFGYKKGDFPVTEKAYAQEVSLPLFPTLTLAQQNKVIWLIEKFVNKMITKGS